MKITNKYMPYIHLTIVLLIAIEPGLINNWLKIILYAIYTGVWIYTDWKR